MHCGVTSCCFNCDFNALTVQFLPQCSGVLSNVHREQFSCEVQPPPTSSLSPPQPPIAAERWPLGTPGRLACTEHLKHSSPLVLCALHTGFRVRLQHICSAQFGQFGQEWVLQLRQFMDQLENIAHHIFCWISTDFFTRKVGPLQY